MSTILSEKKTLSPWAKGGIGLGAGALLLVLVGLLFPTAAAFFPLVSLWCRPLPARPLLRSARPPSRQSRIPKSNIVFKISRLLKCRRDILSSGGLPSCLRRPESLYCKL